MGRSSVILALGLGLFVGRVARAQETSGAMVQTELERVAQISPDEKAAYASSAAREIAAHADSVSRMADAALATGARNDVRCLATRRTALSRLAQVSATANAQLDADLSMNRSELADHELRQVAVALDKARGLAGEAEQCLPTETSSNRSIPVLRETPSFDAFDVGFDPPEVSPFE